MLDPKTHKWIAMAITVAVAVILYVGTLIF